MADLLNTFNNQLTNLSKVLTNRFPENKDLQLAHTSTKALCSCNKKKPIELFTLYVYRYRSIIIDKDESLMLDTDFAGDMSKSDNDNNSFNIMVNLKNNWKSLTDTEKDHIWKDLQVLIKLTDKHIQTTLANNK